MNKKHQIISLVILILFAWISPVQAETWRPVASGTLYGISGIALIAKQEDTTSFLVVHDNKNPGEPQVGWVFVKGEEAPIYREVKLLSTSTDVPVDLEAITTIPDQPYQFLALASEGKIYHLQLTPNYQYAKIIKVFSLPQMPSQTNCEGLTLQQVNGVLVAAWAHRGSNEDPGMLYWSQLDLDTYSFSGPIQSVPLVTPLLESNVRQVSDLKIDPSGAAFISSTTDPGNEGPFTSAFYLIGTFQVEQESAKIGFLGSESMLPLLRFNYHKIEAIEFISGENGGVVFGTDDESFGSFIYLTR